MFKRFREKRKDRKTLLQFQEVFLRKEELIMPVFLVDGQGIKKEILSMKEVYHYSVDVLIKELEKWILKGLHSILLFGVPENKGIEQTYHYQGLVQTGISLIKRKFPKLEIISDVCLCSYSHDGQCHIGDNDETCRILSEIALSHAVSGADIVAPSDMMDGRVYFIRKKLDEAGFEKTKILSYAAKFASGFYGPFRDAAGSSPKKGDRKSYQMNPANALEALEEISADIEEGASSVIVKPALSYLDIIYRASSSFNIPIAAYQVSGEYASIRYLIENGLAKEELIYETAISIKRAGASRIISYFTPYLLEKLDEYQSL
ncbi:MAG TPA: porphobilinogen synthase [Spirochaetia bacterium]|nr:MAG: hypothetical protein A2Y41_04265 [Spirochaetes bacterium GWB1_36_13]HCL57146.1 porphobilinogen synthase [Spirochaetia bacterium]